MPVTRRLTLSLDSLLERALDEAPQRLALPEGASDAEKLRAYARRGYESALEGDLDRERLATYRRWADDDDLERVGRTAARRAARHGVHDER
jgi:hypothetical protein